MTDHEEQLTRTTDHDDWPRRSRRLTTKNDWSWRRLTTTTKKHDWPRKTTDHDDWPRRLTTIWLCTIWTYEDASVCNFCHIWTCLGGKFSIVLLSANALWDLFAVKKDVCTHLLTQEYMIMCSFEHNFPLVRPMRRVSTILYQLRDVTACKFSLKRRISALVWVTWTPPCATFDIYGHVWAESFHCFAHCERTMRCVHCKTTCVYRHESHMTKEGYRYVFLRKTRTHVRERVFNWIFVCIRGDQVKIMETDTSSYVISCT